MVHVVDLSFIWSVLSRLTHHSTHNIPESAHSVSKNEIDLSPIHSSIVLIVSVLTASARGVMEDKLLRYEQHQSTRNVHHIVSKIFT